MKKFTYLVAPLMVLPFLVGCGNKAKTHKVSVSEWNSDAIKFTDKNGKAFTEKSKVTHGRDFTFRVEAKQANADGAKKEVFKEGIFAFIGETVYLGEYDFVYNDTDYTSATVTIPGASITNDVVLAGVEWEEGHYICELPFLAGTGIAGIETQSGATIETVGGYYAYFPSHETVTITFSNSDGNAFPGMLDIALGVNDEYIYNISEAVLFEGWATYTAIDGTLTIDPDAYLTAFLGREPIVNLVLMARGVGYKLLDSLDWDTIKLISDYGYAASFFYSGEEKTIKVNEQDHVVRIIGFGEDLIDDEYVRYAGITFQFKTLVSDSEGNPILTHWSDTDSRYNANYNFLNSTLNSKIGEVFDMLPDELKADGMIETVKKHVGIYGDDPETEEVETGWNAKEYSTKLFPIAEQEHYDDPSNVVSGEASGEYTFYAEAESGGTLHDERSLKAANGNGYAYWTRSPRTGSQGGAAFAVSIAGAVDTEGQWCRTHDYALAPCFCI